MKTTLPLKNLTLLLEQANVATREYTYDRRVAPQMVNLPIRPSLAVTLEKAEGRTLNLIIRRGYSDWGTLKWTTKSRESEFLTRLCRSMIDHGAPSHHLEGR